MMEYVIWGIESEGNTEVLLLSEFQGKAITNNHTAEQLLQVLENKYGCQGCRIQKIDLNTKTLTLF